MNRLDKNVLKRADININFLSSVPFMVLCNFFLKQNTRMEGEEKMKEGGEGRNKGKKWEVKGNEK
jgi:hypothetical protein